MLLSLTSTTMQFFIKMVTDLKKKKMEFRVVMISEDGQ